LVDEANCISAWGHDFRPDYLQLGELIDSLGHPIVIALTATAAPPVRDEIIERLHLDDPVVVVHGFDRPNIHLAVERFDDVESKDRALLADVEARAGRGDSGIVYVGTRKRAEVLAAALIERGVRAAAYHAGMATKRRDDAQRRFMDGEVDVMVATTAFGMGIDKPDVRFVVHAEIAESLDAYYQEVGRAGRDGDASVATLYYQPSDLSLRRFLAAGAGVKPEDVAAVLGVLRGERGGAERKALGERTGLSDRRVAHVLRRLDDVGAATLGRAVARAADDRRSVEEVVAAIATIDEQRASMQKSRIEMMRSYAEGRVCRRRQLLTYFGEHYERDCGHCDNCDAGRAHDDVPRVESGFAPGDRVRHDQFGPGQVMRTEADSIVVLFDDVGYKTLASAIVAAENLLAPG
jgi:ATP-dependent DNA helicase RecQ